MNIPATASELFKGGKLVTGKALADRLRRGKNVQEAARMDGPFLQTSPTNMMDFIYGQDQAVVPPGTLFAFNIMTAETGFAYWFRKSLVKRTKSIWDEDPVTEEELPEPQQYDEEEILAAARKKTTLTQPTWGPLYKWDVKAVAGPNLDIACIYQGIQLYMRRLSEQLIDEAAARGEVSDMIIPVGRLYNDPYMHPTHGKLTTSHKVEIMGWAAIDRPDIEWIGKPPTDAQKIRDARKNPASARNIKRRARRTA